MHSSLKKGLSWTLSYGIIFSFPAWALLSRVAHAGGEEIESKAAPAASKATAPAKPAPKPTATPAAAPKAAAGSKKGDSESHKSKAELESEESYSEKKEKGEVAPKVTNCSDKKMLQNLAHGQAHDPGPRCDTIPNAGLSPMCWQQVFMLLGAARTNGLIANNSLDATKAAQQAAAWTVVEGNIIKPNVFSSGKTASNGPKEDELKTVFTRMADDSIQDKKQCCKQLNFQAAELADWIYKKSQKEGNKDIKIHQKIHDLYNKQAADCDKAQKVSPAPAAGFVAPAAAHSSQAPEKKKSIWPAVFWGLAAGALLFFLLFKRKKKSGGNPPPTPPTPPATTGGGLTYPVLTTTTTGRDITTGGSSTGSLTYPADTTGTTTGRDITTGGSGTVTGSTTATTTTSTSTTTGGTTATSAYPDLSTSGTSRTTDGTTRTIAK